MKNLIEFENGSKIIIQPDSPKSLRGRTFNHLLWLDEEIIDIAPECAKLIDENLDDLLL